MEDTRTYPHKPRETTFKPSLIVVQLKRATPSQASRGASPRALSVGAIRALNFDPFYTTVPVLLLATAIGYLLGALPIADRVSRRRGVDIFSTGTGLAGATNVRRQVGKFPSAIVMLGDFAKGALAVIAADLLGVEKGSVWILLPAAAAIVGHWKSVFTGFRGGDALVTLGGIIIALFPLHGFISVAVASAIALAAQRLPFSSLLNIVFGYLTLAILNYNEVFTQGHPALTLGLGGLCAMVLAYAIRGHVGRRRLSDDWEESEDAGAANNQPEGQG